MFAKLFAIAAFSQTELKSNWDLHYGAHCHWREDVFQKFNVTNMREVLNVEPAIDDISHYHATIPDYFRSFITVQFIAEHFQEMPSTMKPQAKRVLEESASIFAANAMCHPRDRVGKFDWSDVMQLHQMLQTPFYKFMQKKGIDNLREL
jgi:hypothetical protein